MGSKPIPEHTFRQARILLRWLLIAFAASTLLFTALGSFYLLRQHRFRSNAVVAQGMVTGIESRSSKSTRTSRSSSRVYAPVVEFRDSRGNQHHFIAAVWTGRQSGYRVGDTVSVLYDPAHPEHAAIDEFWQLYLMPFILLAMAAGSLVFLLVFYTAQRNLERRKNNNFPSA